MRLIVPSVSQAISLLVVPSMHTVAVRSAGKAALSAHRHPYVINAVLDMASSVATVSTALMASVLCALAPEAKLA
jgi:hypothetical protein